MKKEKIMSDPNKTLMGILAVLTIGFFIGFSSAYYKPGPNAENGEPGMAAYNQMREETINRNKVKGIIALSVECNPPGACKALGINAKQECRLSNNTK